MRGIRPAHLLLLVSLCVVTPDGAAAQQVRGRIIEDAGGRPATAARIVVFDESGTARSQMVVDTTGGFRFELPHAGIYILQIDRLGFQPYTSPELVIGADERMILEIRLSVDAIPLEPLRVVRRARPLLKGGKFYEVRDREEHIRLTGIGHFISRDDLERQSPQKLADAFRLIAGVRVRSSGGSMGRRTIRMSRAPSLGVRGPDCAPVVFLDGMMVGAGDAGDYLLSELSPSGIEGVEVYRNLSEAPAEFGVPEARCGVIAVWSRRSAR